MSLALTLPSPPGEGEDRPRIAAPPPQFPLLGERARVRAIDLLPASSAQLLSP